MIPAPQTDRKRERQLAARLHLIKRRAHIVRIARVLCMRPARSLAELGEEALNELWDAALAFEDGPLIIRLCLEYRRREQEVLHG